MGESVWSLLNVMRRAFPSCVTTGPTSSLTYVLPELDCGAKLSLDPNTSYQDDEEAIDSSNELEELSSWKHEELIGSIKLLLERFSIGVEDDE